MGCLGRRVEVDQDPGNQWCHSGQPQQSLTHYISWHHHWNQILKIQKLQIMLYY